MTFKRSILAAVLRTDFGRGVQKNRSREASQEIIIII